VYWIRQYTYPLFLAIGVHVLAGWLLVSGWAPQKQVSQSIKPPVVMASLVVFEPQVKPQRVAKPKPKAKPKPELKSANVPSAEVKVKPKVQPSSALDDAVRQRERLAEEAARARAEAARQARLARLSQLAQTAMEQVMADEVAQAQAGSVEQIAQSYRLGIYELVRQNWSRPPSARNGMSAKLLVELIPTGEVVSVSVVTSSGNVAFDRSAEQAVRRSRRFEVPLDNGVFEAHFRSFYFLFQPEDLLR